MVEMYCKTSITVTYWLHDNIIFLLNMGCLSPTVSLFYKSKTDTISLLMSSSISR